VNTRRMPLILMILMVAFFWAAFDSTVACASDIYIAQVTAGGSTGADCADAYAYTWFNNASNWGSKSGQVGPGTTVHLCGTISSALAAHGSGTSGNPITILFDSATSGQLTAPALPATGALVLSGYNYITVNGGGTGIIQSTNNGSPASLCSGSSYANDISSVAILANNSNNLTVENLKIGPLYTHVCTADDSSSHSALSPPGPVCVQFGGDNVTITGNVMHDAAWCLFGSGNNLNIGGNTIYNFDHGLGMGIDSASGSLSGVYFYKNTLYGANVWDTDDNSFHHDGIHLWAYCASGSGYCPNTTITNAYVYDNVFEGNWGNNINAPVFLEENIGTVWVFNNFFNGSSMIGWGTGLCNCNAQTLYAYNNTLLGFSNSDNIPGAMNLNNAIGTVENNIILTADTLISTTSPWLNGSASSETLSHNLYANGGVNSFVWCPPSGGSCDFYKSTQFSSWVSSSGDTNSNYISSVSGIINSDGTLPSASPAKGVGVNLYSLCNGQPTPGLGALCQDAAGNQRLSSGAWNLGAFDLPSLHPGAPANLSGSVQQ